MVEYFAWLSKKGDWIKGKRYEGLRQKGGSRLVENPISDARNEVQDRAGEERSGK